VSSRGGWTKIIFQQALQSQIGVQIPMHKLCGVTIVAFIASTFTALAAPQSF
jgi:hypothetical protein